MRKRILVLIFLMISSALFIKQKGWYNNLSLQPNIAQTQVLGENKTINYPNTSVINKYSYILEEIKDNDNLVLINNLKDKKTSDEIRKEYDCAFLVNGGYYTPEYTHTGLFITDYKVLNSYRKNNLLNGFVSINDFSVARITKEMPTGNLRIAMQTGPIIKENNFYSPDYWNGKTGRRIIALTSGDNKLYFLVIYDKTSVFEGPALNGIKDILKEVEEKEKLEFADAVTLDGGTASVFWSKNITLKELSMVGSYFCLQER